MATGYQVIRTDFRHMPTECVVLQFDGGSRGNPGPSGAGFVVREAKTGRILYQKGVWIGRATNNVAEYTGLLAALDYAAEQKYAHLHVEGDSMLVVNHLKGAWKAAKMADMYQKAMASLARFSYVAIRHVYRRDNAEADQAANAAMDGERDVVLTEAALSQGGGLNT